MPEKPDRPKPDLVGPLGLALILLLAIGAYVLFPRLQAVFSYQDCIASGRITGC